MACSTMEEGEYLQSEKLRCLNIAILCLQKAEKLRKRRRSRRWWVRPAYDNCKTFSEFFTLIPQLRFNDREMFFVYTRMTPERYDHLLSLVDERLKKYSLRDPVSPNERLMITLVFLATGESQVQLSFRFRRGRATICKVLSETCSVLWDVLCPKYLRIPNSEEWREISTAFCESWNFPSCIGAIDGKHFVIQSPKLSGSLFYNYKNSFSSLVLAMCDSNYKFIYVDIGSAGREGDASVFTQSKLFKALEEDSLHIPPPHLIPGSQTTLPHVIVGDEAFPMRPYLMRPYPGRGKKLLPFSQKIYNYRLSRARRVIENAFGILVARWRIFRSPLHADIENCELYIRAALVLHNYLRCDFSEDDSTSRLYIPSEFVDSENLDGSVTPGTWRNEAQNITGVTDIRRLGANMHARNVADIRDNFAKFFVSPAGAVPWQHRMVS